LCFSLNSLIKCSKIFWSKLSPPKYVSPDVDKTSKTPSPKSNN
jgi:hypothetical protein